jgi:alanine dehydrogenase
MHACIILKNLITNSEALCAGGQDSLEVEFLYLSQKDVIATGLTMKDDIEIVEEVFRAHGEGKVSMPPKISLPFDEPEIGFINAMPAYVKTMPAAGMKWAGGFWNNPKKYGLPSIQAIIILNDPHTGFPLAIMDGAWITAMRTGAVTAVGAKYLAREYSEVVGIIGAGMQGRYQIMALNEVLDINKVLVFDLSKESREVYAKEIGGKLGLDVEPVESAEEATRGSDILVTATSSLEPFIEDEWLKEGNFTCAIGSFREIDDDVALNADKIVVDSLEQCIHRGNLHDLFERGIITKEMIHSELGEVVAGKKEGRVSDYEKILLVPIGMGSEDVATALRVYQTASEKGVGRKLSLLG